jgi:DNA-binding transcriptional ArsR family regulator
MSTTLPDGIRDLLANRIDSFEKLEIVVALHAAPRTTLSIEEMCRRLKLTRDTVRQATMELRGASLVVLTSAGDVQLLPPSERDHAILEQLVRLYDEDRFTVVKAMGEIALDRIRGMASRAFADAFVIRKKPPKDGNDG